MKSDSLKIELVANGILGQVSRQSDSAGRVRYMAINEESQQKDAS